MTYPGGREYLQPREQEILDGFPVTRTADDFDSYQIWLTELLTRNRNALVGAFMGSGKTAVALLAFYELWEEHYHTLKMLVVAPYYVALDTWPTEIMTWDFAREFTYSVVMGDEETRVRALDLDVDIYIINRENYKWLCEHLGFSDWPFQVLVYDEASRLGSGKKRTTPKKKGERSNVSEFGYVSKSAPHFHIRWLLSGTPASEGLIKLWGPIYVLDRGERLGRSITAFRNRWFKWDGYKYKYFPFEHSRDEIMGLLTDIMWYLKEEDYLRLPPLQVVDRIVRLDAKDLRAYRQFERTLLYEEEDIEAANRAVLTGKLLQFANGSVYDNADDEDHEDHLRTPPKAVHVHDRKLDELASIFEEADGRPVLVAYSYKFDVHAIRKRFPWVRVYGESGTDLKDWNARKVRAMVLHPASAAHGLNFQTGGNLAVFYGLTASLELYQQFIKRLHRRGQNGDFVRLYRILAAETEDVRYARLLMEKGVTQDDILEAVRVRAEEIQ